MPDLKKFIQYHISQIREHPEAERLLNNLDYCQELNMLEHTLEVLAQPIPLVPELIRPYLEALKAFHSWLKDEIAHTSLPPELDELYQLEHHLSYFQDTAVENLFWYDLTSRPDPALEDPRVNQIGTQYERRYRPGDRLPDFNF